MLTLSQFQSPELARIYTKRYVDTMLGYDEKLFEHFIKTGIIKEGDPKVLAAMFYAPVVMYMGIWDREPKKAKKCEAAIKKHVEQFFLMTQSVHQFVSISHQKQKYYQIDRQQGY